MVIIELELQGQAINEIEVGYTIAFDTGDYEVRIENDFTLRADKEDFQISPDPDKVETNSERLQQHTGRVLGNRATLARTSGVAEG